MLSAIFLSDEVNMSPKGPQAELLGVQHVSPNLGVFRHDSSVHVLSCSHIQKSLGRLFNLFGSFDSLSMSCFVVFLPSFMDISWHGSLSPSKRPRVGQWGGRQNLGPAMGNPCGEIPGETPSYQDDLAPVDILGRSQGKIYKKVVTSQKICWHPAILILQIKYALRIIQRCSGILHLGLLQNFSRDGRWNGYQRIPT